jgi:hypothetical protein
MKATFLCCLVFSMVLLGSPVQALEPFVPYDNFNTIFLDPDKWTGAENNFGVVVLESFREIDWGRLHFRNRIYSGTLSDSGWGVGGTRVYFAEGDKVTAIKARVQVNCVEVKSCASNPMFTRAAVRLGGSFFNTGTPTPASGVNDVLAYISLQRQSDSTDKPYLLNVAANVLHCTNANCTTSTSIGSSNMGTISVFGTAVMSIQWDKDNHQFIFKLEGKSIAYIPYNLPDTSPPGLQTNKRIEVSNILPNCTGESRPVAFIDAYIDNVFVNQTAGP